MLCQEPLPCNRPFAQNSSTKDEPWLAGNVRNSMFLCVLKVQVTHCTLYI